MSEKPRLFLSHIHEEAALARVLQKWTEDSFPGQCTVFVSSDDKSIKKGSKWLDEIGDALTEARALVVLCSPNSLQRPWINFETGFGYARKLPVFPVCHSGQRLGELPRPLGDFHGFEIGRDAKFCNDFLTGIGKPLGFPKAPRIDSKTMMAEINASLPQQSAAQISGNKQAHGVPPVKTDEDISAGCKKVLNMIGNERFANGSPRTRALIARLEGEMTPQQVYHYLDVLVDEGLIEISEFDNETCLVTIKGGRRLWG